MRIENKKWFLIGIVICILAFSIAYGFIGEGEEVIEIKDCFDRNYNKIIGLECEDKHMEIEGEVLGTIMIIIGFIGFIIAVWNIDPFQRGKLK